MVGWNAEKAVFVVLVFEGVVIRGSKVFRKCLRCVSELIISFTGIFSEVYRVKSLTLYIF